MDKDKIIEYLGEIDVRLAEIIDEYKVAEDVNKFLLNLAIGNIETIEEAQIKASELWWSYGRQKM